MAELSSYDKFQQCANDIRRLQHEMRDVKSKIYNALDDLRGKNSNLQEEIHYHLIEMGEMGGFLAEFADILNDTSNLFIEYNSPLSFDFIVGFDIGEWWKQAYPIIEQIATLTGAITGVAAITTSPLIFIKWMRGKLQERKSKDEYTWVKLILTKKEWAVSTLSEELNLSEDEAKKILKGFGYKWDQQKKSYVSTENTQKLRDINMHKSGWI